MLERQLIIFTPSAIGGGCIGGHGTSGRRPRRQRKTLELGVKAAERRVQAELEARVEWELFLVELFLNSIAP